MKNLLNFFFSFDKLFKEKLIVPFFWLAIIYYGLRFLVQAFDTVQLDPLNWIISPLSWFVKIALTLIAIRIVSELIVAVFRINDNLSPDKGKSELADIDPIAEARKAAELAAARTRETTKSLGEKATAATKSVGKKADEMASNVQSKAKSVTQSTKEKLTPDAKATDAKPVKVTKAKTVDVTPNPTPRKRGRPKGSTNKAKAKSTSKAKTTTAKKTTATKKTTSKSSTTAKKRGPKPGQKVLRDADGNLLKKDGTPRKKPGPKPKS